MGHIAGIIALFDTPKELYKAAETVRDAGFKQFDTYTPFPVHGMEKAQGLKDSPLGWIVLGGGATGLLTGILLQGWVAVKAYPLVISGKPLFSYQAFVPVTFELMVLFSAFAAVFGMFALNKLPRWNNPFFNYSFAEAVSSDKFAIGIDAADPLFDEEKVKKMLQELGGKHMEVINHD